ncbi:uncharacterized protein DEA37_0011242 [Paragonimus westermani]|uniref:Integrase catalytic domain-containing protein n=1 Tax=Paragonimus westermani TaxID=34504 RepID=A0A5J4NEY0_9TREM|nr:uncharacterized protein DEA37_0011242 [Paragonimus westermani]
MRRLVYHPQSNGQGERFIETCKRSLIKLEGEECISEILDTFLRAYRSSPNQALLNNGSPAEAFLGRIRRTALDAMLPSIVSK